MPIVVISVIRTVITIMIAAIGITIIAITDKDHVCTLLNAF